MDDAPGLPTFRRERWSRLGPFVGSVDGQSQQPLIDANLDDLATVWERATQTTPSSAGERPERAPALMLFVR